MTDSLIERVALAFWGDEYDGSEYQLRGARAAIATMREPTSKQLDAGYAAISERQCDDDLAFGWRAMIDVALEEGK
jgi:hypothetical protein